MNITIEHLYSRQSRQSLNIRQFISDVPIPIGSMYSIYANIGGILMVNVTIYSIHGSYGIYFIGDKLTVTFSNADCRGSRKSW